MIMPHETENKIKDEITKKKKKKRKFEDEK